MTARLSRSMQPFNTGMSIWELPQDSSLPLLLTDAGLQSQGPFTSNWVPTLQDPLELERPRVQKIWLKPLEYCVLCSIAQIRSTTK
jgi:hypothetical protein